MVICLYDFTGEGATQALSVWIIFLFSHIPNSMLSNSRPTLEEGRGVIDWGHMGTFWVKDNVLYLGRGVGYTGIYIYQII